MQEMDFQAPYLVVMNKSENKKDLTLFPPDSIAISAKENKGIDKLKREILKQFRDEYIFCKLFIPYDKSNVYAQNKHLLVERRLEFNDDGQIVHATIPLRYADTFLAFIIEREQII